VLFTFKVNIICCFPLRDSAEDADKFHPVISISFLCGTTCTVIIFAWQIVLQKLILFTTAFFITFIFLKQLLNTSTTLKIVFYQH